MADLFLQHFAGGAGVEPDNATKLLGGVQKTVQDGAGMAYRDGATGVVMYRYDELPGRADFGLQLKTKFHNPAGLGARVRLCLDVVDSSNYLYMEVVAGSGAGGWTGLGKPEFKFGKVVGGVDTVLLGPVEVNGGATLVVDQLYTWELVRSLNPTTGEVTYEFRFEDSWLDAPRPAAAATYVDDTLSHENRATGWNFTTPNGTDLKIDDLRCFELVGADVDLEDRVLQVGAETFDAAGMRARSISPIECRNNYLAGSEFVFRESVPWVEQSFRNEQYVVWKDQGKVLFRGYITQAVRGGSPAAQTVTYSCRGRKHRMGYVPVRHQTTLAQRIVWNSPDNLDYVNALDKGAFTAKSYAAAIRWYFSTFAEDMKKQGATRADAEVPYEDGDLTPLESLMPVRTELTGNALSQLAALIGQLQAYAFVHEPSTDLWRFYKVTGLTAIALQTDDDRLVASSLTEDSTNVYTRVCVSTMHREKVRAQAKKSDGGLLANWDSFFEEHFTPEKARRSSVAATIVSVSLGTGPLGEDQIVVEYPTTPRTYSNEWLNSQLRVTSGAATGETFGILQQDCAGVAPWGGFITIAGNFVGLPVVTDTVVLEALPDLGQRNQFADVFASFQIADPDAGDLVMPQDGGCAKMRAKFGSIGNGTDGADGGTDLQESHRLPVFKGPGFVNGVIWVPAGGVYDPNPTASHPQNVDGGYIPPTDVVLDYDYWKLTVLSSCKPTVGYAGTGFSLDESKWAGGGEAGPNDLNIQRTLPMEESDWRDATQTEIVKARIQEILDVVSQRQFVGQPEFQGLRYEFSDLGVSLNLGSPAGTVPWAGLYVLPISVSFRYSSTGAGDRTVLDLGGTSNFAASGQAFVGALRAESMLERLKSNAAKLRDLQECFAQTANVDDPKSPSEPANPTCDTRVQTSFTSGVPRERAPGATKPKKLDKQLELIFFFLLAVAANKSGGEGFSYNAPDGSNGDDGYFTDSTGTKFRPNADGTGWETLDGAAYSPVYGGALGAALSNLGKTLANGTGALLAPGDTVGPDGAVHYNSDGSRQDLAAGSTVPSSLTSLVEANKKSAEGLSVSPSGVVTGVDGSTYVANADGTWTKLSGSGPAAGPLVGGALGAALGNLGKSFSSASGAEVAPGTAIPAGGIDRYNPDGSINHIPPGGGATVPGSAGSQAAANKKLLEGATVNNDGSVTFPNGRFQPREDGGWTPVAGSGPGGSTPTTGPQVGGVAGGSAAKCGTTTHGATTPGSGPGAMVPPGTVVDSDLAIYYLPTQHVDDPESEVLEAGDIAPASTLDQWQALAHAAGLEVHDLADRGGVVYRTPIGGGSGVRYWRVLAGTTTFVEVEAAGGGAGTGLNSGDWDDVAGPVELNLGLAFHGVTQIIAADYTVAREDNGKLVRVDLTVADHTVTLDDTPGVFVKGEFRVTIVLSDSPLGHILTIDAGSGVIGGAGTTLDLENEGDSVTLVRSQGGWDIIGRNVPPPVGSITPDGGWSALTGDAAIKGGLDITAGTWTPRKHAQVTLAIVQALLNAGVTIP